jgi:VWFA-related protein
MRRRIALPAPLACVLVAVSSGAAVPAGQDPPAPFRSSASLVEVDVIVKDRDGNFVSGLTADDFEVLEEGKPQRIEHFYLVTENPTGSGEPRPDVVLPRLPDQTGRRVFLLLFDAHHLSAPAIARVKHAAMEFLNGHFRAGDLGGVYVNGRLWRNRMTNDRQELLDGVRSLSPEFESPAKRLAALATFPRIPGEFDAVRIERGDQRLAQNLAVENCTAEPNSCQQEGGREYVEERIDTKAKTYVAEARRAATLTVDALAHVTRNLARLEGRKTVVVISEGFFTHDLRSELPKIAGQAARAGIALYTLNARGTQGAAGRILPDASVARGTISTLGDTSEEGLDLLASETGGLAFRGTDDFARALSSIAGDTSTYYVLAYSPDNTTLDGTFRRIELRTKWQGVTLRARRGYVASPLPPPRAIRTAR